MAASGLEYLRKRFPVGALPDSDRIASELSADAEWAAILRRLDRQYRTYLRPITAAVKPAEAALVLDALHPWLAAAEQLAAAAAAQRGEPLVGFELRLWDQPPAAVLSINRDLNDSDVTEDAVVLRWPEGVRGGIYWTLGTVFAWDIRGTASDVIVRASDAQAAEWKWLVGDRVKRIDTARWRAWRHLDGPDEGSPAERSHALRVALLRGIAEGAESWLYKGTIWRGQSLPLPPAGAAQEALFRFVGEAIGAASDDAPVESCLGERELLSPLEALQADRAAERARERATATLTDLRARASPLEARLMRELEASGRPLQDVAAAIGIAEGTAKSLRSRLRTKAGIKPRQKK